MHKWLPAFTLAALAITVSACERRADPAPPAPPAAQPIAEPAPLPLPTPSPVLDRARLLRAMEDAASAYAYAAGEAPGAEALSGRRFLVRQAFGCSDSGDASADAAGGLAAWNWLEDRKAIQISLTPGDWTGSPLVAGRAENWEAVEGFWLDRPWLRAEGCPGVAPDPLASGPTTPSPQTMGLAAVFDAEGSRLGRRNGRAYSFVVRGKDGAPATAPVAGYRLVLEGRLAAFADGRAINCRADTPDQRPVCVAAARLDRVAFEDAAGSVLSEWRPG